MTDFYVSIQIVGTPDDCIQQMGELQRLTGTDHIVCDFSYGRMPHHESELNMRLFAREALPTLQQIGRAPSELQSLMRISYAVFCLTKKNNNNANTIIYRT